jgi:hypothetical protein
MLLRAIPCITISAGFIIAQDNASDGSRNLRSRLVNRGNHCVASMRRGVNNPVWVLIILIVVILIGLVLSRISLH